MESSHGKGKMSVFLYVPNIIGYIRILLTIYSFRVAFVDWKTSILCYSLSFVCDYFDGLFARFFDQCSSFGAVLDMVTDRCSTAGLLFILSHLYPDFLFLFLGLIMLDFSSHWIHMYSTKGHHKAIESSRNMILRLYYGCYPFFGFCCVGTELAYILLYVLFYEPDISVVAPLNQLCYYLCLPACIFKNIINIAQLMSAASTIAEMDAETANNVKSN